MEKEFVTYEIALMLKELDFNKECFKVYDEKGYLQDEDVMDKLKLKKVLAPLWQQAIDFLEEKNIVVEILPKEDGKYSVAYYHKDMSLEEIYEFFHNAEVVQYTLYNTKIKAREAAILKAIELCQK